jgi:arylsulfatase A-like enzyme
LVLPRGTGAPGCFRFLLQSPEESAPPAEPVSLRPGRRRNRSAAAAVLLAVVLIAGVLAVAAVVRREPPADTLSFRDQACSLPPTWLDRIVRGYHPPRSGQIAILPKTPAYMGTAGGGWSHSGPWPYLENVPVVFYGPGVIPKAGEVARQTTIADLAPTLAALMGFDFETEDGRVLNEVVVSKRRPRLVVVVVWDGGGWNTLRQWPNDWPNLARLMQRGVSYTNATVGSSPSVTPSIHTTLGTGVFPWRHGITGIPVRDEAGVVVDSFLKGESSRFIEVPTLAERWDEAQDNRALVGMVGYEPWHLGMIGRGAEASAGDKDDAAWLETETNEWITNPDHYRLPPALAATGGLEQDIARLDAADGEKNGAWLDQEILDDPDRVEETPAFIVYHTRAMLHMIRSEGYGKDSITDLLFTNYKQIDRVGHYFNMASEEVHDSVIETDRRLGLLVDFLNEEVGRGRWAVVVTADHGQQPDAEAIDGYGINPKEILADVNREFGPIVRAVWPTEVFLLDEVMEEREVSVEEVARFLADYRLRDNAADERVLATGSGEFGPNDRLLALAMPSRLLDTLSCQGDRPERGPDG